MTFSIFAWQKPVPQSLIRTAAAACLLAALPILSMAAPDKDATAKKPTAVASKPAAKKPAQPAAKKPAASSSSKAEARAKAKARAEANAATKAKQEAGRANLKSAAVSVAAGMSAAEAALTPTELAIANKIYVGTIACELGASVILTADPKTPGFFTLQGKDFRYRMSPVATSSGAVRLEDPKAGAVWIQLGNKSMLMNQKLGQRMADDCMAPQQLALAETLKKNPQASLFDPLPKKVVVDEAKAPGVINVFPAPVTN